MSVRRFHFNGGTSSKHIDSDDLGVHIRPIQRGPCFSNKAVKEIGGGGGGRIVITACPGEGYWSKLEAHMRQAV